MIKHGVGGSVCVSPGKAMLNLLEPDELLDIFMCNPPEGFESLKLDVEGNLLPCFFARFNILTTLDNSQLWIKKLVERYPILQKFLIIPALFAGTTVTEYATYPNFANYVYLLSRLKNKFLRSKAQLLIIKDIPQHSPLLSTEENTATEKLISACRQNGFEIVSGQALAYVPIDFSSVDEYLQRLSKLRRKDFRRKLREGIRVKVEEVSGGDTRFFKKEFLDDLYSMYLNVFEQSQIHFDKLSRSFFQQLLQNDKSGIRLFLYRLADRLIGYNICFVQQDMLLDKYIGFVYPEARDTNLYFLSWFYNLEYALQHKLRYYVVGWTDPEVKASLGAKFTLTRHAVFVRNPMLRFVLKKFQHFFESDQNWIKRENDQRLSITAE